MKSHGEMGKHFSTNEKATYGSKCSTIIPKNQLCIHMTSGLKFLFKESGAVLESRTVGTFHTMFPIIFKSSYLGERVGIWHREQSCQEKNRNVTMLALPRAAAGWGTECTISPSLQKAKQKAGKEGQLSNTRLFIQAR